MSNQIGGEGAQVGDITTGHTAGRDIDIGAPAELLIALIERQIDKESQFRMLLINALELQHSKVMHELRILRLIIGAVSIALLVLLIIIL